MKIGVNINIDVKKIDKGRLYVSGDKTWLNLTAFIDTEEVSKYGDNGIVNQSTTKKERDEGIKLPILGNTKVFYIADEGGNTSNGTTGGTNPEDDDIPF